METGGADRQRGTGPLKEEAMRREGRSEAGEGGRVGENLCTQTRMHYIRAVGRLSELEPPNLGLALHCGTSSLSPSLPSLPSLPPSYIPPSYPTPSLPITTLRQIHPSCLPPTLPFSPPLPPTHSLSRTSGLDGRAPALKSLIQSRTSL